MDGRLSGIEACVFDAYGTLFDFAAAARACRDVLGERTDQLTALWRDKQLQYTWLRAAQDRHADFWQVTGDALDFVLETMGFDRPGLRERASRHEDEPPDRILRVSRGGGQIARGQAIGAGRAAARRRLARRDAGAPGEAAADRLSQAEQAEADPLLEDAFYQSGIYTGIISRRDRHCFLIGRTGSGKSAILQCPPSSATNFS